MRHDAGRSWSSTCNMPWREMSSPLAMALFYVLCLAQLRLLRLPVGC